MACVATCSATRSALTPAWPKAQKVAQMCSQSIRSSRALPGLVLREELQLAFFVAPTEALADPLQLALADVPGNPGEQRPRLAPQRRAGMLQLQRPPARRAYPRQQLATAGGYEAVAQQFQVDFRAHPPQQRQPAVAEKVRRRRQWIVGAAADPHPAFAVGREQRRQQGLQYQRATAGGADGEGVVAGADRTGPERQLA